MHRASQYLLSGIENTAAVVFPTTSMPDTFRIWIFRLDLRSSQVWNELSKEKTMDGQNAIARQQAGATQDIFHAAANFANRGDYCTLILDRLGRILSCGTPAERIFGASQVRLVGRLISDFIAGLFLNGSSPSYCARYLVYLCADGEWRKFEAKDAAGRAFTIELNLARMASVSPEREMFLLNVRRPEQTAGH
ncbi:hypothetical protein [Sulfuritalea sp.]|uniref:hypothetical protein n=1 Tax=Sulfuritalea sp. TaxID=2480090 RepID=UPI00286E08C0|nr:hypothetical protein [Sulfuritalea sp.]